MSMKNFKEMTEEPANAPPENAEPEVLERKFWRNLPMNPPLYGADVPGSIFDARERHWNPKYFTSLLSRALKEAGAAIPGVTQPYLYAGSWRSFFAWHTEDMDLHSVNYLHCGAPKTWYVIPPHARDRFEVLAASLCPELHRHCPEFMRHKEILMSPALLAAHNIPVVKTTHHAREFVVVGPGAYHAGFNHGYNLAESVNFATRSWVPIGAKAGYCTCQEDSVKIDMRLFVRYMDPELAQEVMDSYESSGSEDDSDGEESTLPSEASPEENSSSDGASSSEEIEHSNEVSSSSVTDVQEEELPRLRRNRKPTTKAVESGLADHCEARAKACGQDSEMKSDLRPGCLTSSSDLLKRPLRGLNGNRDPSDRNAKPNKALVKARHDEVGDLATLRSLAAGPRQGNLAQTTGAVASSFGRRVPARKKTSRRLASADRPGNAVAGNGRSSDGASSDSSRKDAEPCKQGHVPSARSAVKRGAAVAWYALFDSILPSLKRARS